MAAGSLNIPEPVNSGGMSTSTLQLQVAGVGRRSSLWISLSLFQFCPHSLFGFMPCFTKIHFFLSCFSSMGMDFFCCLEHGEEMPDCKVPVKITQQTLLGLGVSWHFPPWVRSVCFAQLQHKLRAPSWVRVAQSSSCLAPLSLLL